MIDRAKIRITIVGLGLMGGSIAKSLKKAGVSNIYAIDRDKAVLDMATCENVISKGYENPQDILPSTDLLIICLYPAATISFIKENMEYIKQDSIICDICGVKSLVVEALDNEICDIFQKADFIPTHPMAGREKMGYNESIDNMFDGCSYLMTPLPKNKMKSIEIIEELAYMLGAGKIVKTDAKKHDEYIAFTSQLPHVLAISYMQASQKRPLGSFSGGSFRDVSRVALINEVIWQELFDDNKELLVPQITGLIDELTKFRDIIKDSDDATSREYMKTGRKIKEAYDAGEFD